MWGGYTVPSPGFNCAIFNGSHNAAHLSHCKLGAVRFSARMLQWVLYSDIRNVAGGPVMNKFRSPLLRAFTSSDIHEKWVEGRLLLANFIIISGFVFSS
jgi:hypothetical protein